MKDYWTTTAYTWPQPCPTCHKACTLPLIVSHVNGITGGVKTSMQYKNHNSFSLWVSGLKAVNGALIFITFYKRMMEICLVLLETMEGRGVQCKTKWINIILFCTLMFWCHPATQTVAVLHKLTCHSQMWYFQVENMCLCEVE